MGVWPAIEGIREEDAKCIFDNEADFFIEVLCAFMVDLPGQIEKIRMLMTQSALSDISIEAHKIRGAALSLGATELAETSTAIELAINKGETDIADLLEAFYAAEIKLSLACKPWVDQKT